MPRPSFPKNLREFQHQFATEEACERYLTACRWREGFGCPRCGHRRAYTVAKRRWCIRAVRPPRRSGRREREPVRRGGAGPFTIFDSNGYIVPVFSSANMVIYESEAFAYSPRGQIAIGHVIGVTSEVPSTQVIGPLQTLHVVPTAVSQKLALSVVIGPPMFGFADDCAANFWSWRCRDLDADGWVFGTEFATGW